MATQDRGEDPFAEIDDGGAWDDGTYAEDSFDTPAEQGDEEVLLYGEGADDVPREPTPRRTQATILMITAAGFFLLSLVVLAAFTVAGDGFRGVFDFMSFRTWIWVLFAILVILFVWLLVLLLTTPVREGDDWFDDDADYPVAELADLGAQDAITLRCPTCVNVFSLQDPMARPFYHDCPHCNTRGVYTGKDDPPEVLARIEAYEHDADTSSI